MKRITVLTMLTVLLALWTMTVFGAVPQLINFQGILRDGSGNPVANGSYSVTFRIYDDPSAGNVLWAETTSMTTTNGLFAILLGASNPVPDTVFKGSNRWLGIKVGNDPEMTPRQQLVSVGYSFGFAGWTISDSNLILADRLGGSVGIGEPNPEAKLDVEGDIHASGPITSGNTVTIDGATGTITSSGAANRLLVLDADSVRIVGNFNLGNSSASAGNILKGGSRFIHNFGIANTFIGSNAGNLAMTGASNTASGALALPANTTGNSNTASGAFALFNNTTGFANTANGVQALYSNITGGNNTASGFQSLFNNTDGNENTASGQAALQSNTTGFQNTATGAGALIANSTGSNNTAIGYLANVSAGNQTNSTAIGANAVANASNKIRLGNAAVTVIEGQVAYTFPSDKNQKENFRPVDGNEVLRKIRGFDLTSWNYKGHDPKQFRHYGPMAQDFFAAFGDDGVGRIGTETTLNSGDVAGILMIAVQELGNENADLKARIEHLEEMLREIQAEKPQAKVK